MSFFIAYFQYNNTEKESDTMNENGLSSIKDGKGFNNVICTLTDFRRAKDFYELSLRDNETRKSAYLRANLYSFDQLRELKNKTVLISGLHEAGLKGVIPEKIKVKVIELKSEEDEDILNNFPHLEQVVTSIMSSFSTHPLRDTFSSLIMLFQYTN